MKQRSWIYHEVHHEALAPIALGVQRLFVVDPRQWLFGNAIFDGF